MSSHHKDPIIEFLRSYGVDLEALEQYCRDLRNASDIRFVQGFLTELRDEPEAPSIAMHELADSFEISDSPNTNNTTVERLYACEAFASSEA